MTIEEAYRADRMRHRDDLVVAHIGERPLHGSINEYHAVRLREGDRVRFERTQRMILSDPLSGLATVRFVSVYDGFIVHVDIDGSAIANGRQWLFPEYDFIERIETTKGGD